MKFVEAVKSILELVELLVAKTQIVEGLGTRRIGLKSISIALLSLCEIAFHVKAITFVYKRPGI
eukprot:UC4_evm1s1483